MAYVFDPINNTLIDDEDKSLGNKLALNDDEFQKLLDIPGVFRASEAPIPPPRQEVLDREAINRFMRDNKAEGGRINFGEGTFTFKGNPITLNIKGLKGKSIENVQNLLKIIEDNPNISPQEWFAKTSKVQGASSGLDQLARDLLKYVKGDTKNLSGAVSKEVFDKLKIKKLIKDEIPNLNKISGKVVRQTAGRLAAAKKAVTNTFEAVMRLNEEFKLDPDVDIEELAEQLYGKGASKSVSFLTQTKNDVAKYIDVLKTGTRKNLNIPNFKYPSANQAAEILDSIADRSGSFGFQEGVIRDLKFDVRDNLLKLKKGTTTNLRRVLSDLIKGKGNVIDEAVGLSATFEDAPGYTEATQVIKGKINKRKANTIDKPFSALIKKIKTNSATAKEINDFNTISKRFMKEEGVDSPIIKTGKNLKPEKFIKNFKDYSLEAQANIKELAKKNNFVIQTKSEPLKNIVASLQKNKPLKDKILSGIGKVGKVTGKVLKPLGYGVIGPLAVSTAVKSAEEQGLDLNLLDKTMAFESGDAEVALNNARRRVDPEFAAEERAKDLAQMTDDFEEVGLDEVKPDETLQNFMANGGRAGFSNGGAAGADVDFATQLEYFLTNEDAELPQLSTFKETKNPLEIINDIIDPRNYAYYANKIGARTVLRIAEFAGRIGPATGKLVSDLIQKPAFKITDTDNNNYVQDYMDELPPSNIKGTGIFSEFLENITPTSLEKKIGLDKIIEKQEQKQIDRGSTVGPKVFSDTISLGAEVTAPIFPGLKLLRAYAKSRNLPADNVTKEILVKEIDEVLETQGMNRREFLQATGAGATVILAKMLGFGDEVAQTAKVVEKAAAAPAGVPPYFFDLVEIIKKKGLDVTKRNATKNLENVYSYKGYEIYEDLASGEIRIEKIYPESDMITERQILEYRPGRGDESNPKPADSYEEVTETNSRIYKDEFNEPDYEEGVNIEEILEFIKNEKAN